MNETRAPSTQFEGNFVDDVAERVFMYMVMFLQQSGHIDTRILNQRNGKAFQRISSFITLSAQLRQGNTQVNCCAARCYADVTPRKLALVERRQ